MILVFFTDNKKLQKEQAVKTLRGIFENRVFLVDKASRLAELAARAPIASACDRSALDLMDQLAPWSTPHLRKRLEKEFGVKLDPDVASREDIMKCLLEKYAEWGPRRVHQHMGVPLRPELADELTACLRNLAWPTTTRERPKVRAENYFTLQVPNTKFTVETGAKARLNAAKLEKYSTLWELIQRTIRSVDSEFADSFTGVAVTMGFTDSPHIDTENIGIEIVK